jgi:hypothetical protein
MDDLEQINYIMKVIDMKFFGVEEMINTYLTIPNAKTMMAMSTFSFCNGFIQSCVTFNIISNGEQDKLLKYTRDKFDKLIQNWVK